MSQRNLGTIRARKSAKKAMPASGGNTEMIMRILRMRYVFLTSLSQRNHLFRKRALGIGITLVDLNVLLMICIDKEHRNSSLSKSRPFPLSSLRTLVKPNEVWITIDPIGEVVMSRTWYKWSMGYTVEVDLLLFGFYISKYLACISNTVGV